MNEYISEPGKFEGEPTYAPYFYDSLLNGLYDEELPGGVVEFVVRPTHVAQFPALKGAQTVKLWECPNGFIYTETD